MKRQELFKKLDNFFIGVLSFQLFAGITVYFLTRNELTLPYNIDDKTVSLTVIVVVSLAIIIIKFLTHNAKQNNGVSEEWRISLFTKLTLVRLSLLTLSNMIVIILFNLSADYLLLLIYLILIILLFAYRPLPKKFEDEFNKK